MDPTQQPILPPPVGAATGISEPSPADAGVLQPPPQPMNHLLSIGLTMPSTVNTIPPPPGAGIVLPQAGAAPPFPPMSTAAMNQIHPMMQFPVITDPIILGQLTGFPGELLANSPSMMAGAQQFLAQKMMMQQSNMLYNQAGVAPVQALITPQQMQFMHQQRLQAQLAVNQANAAKSTISNSNKGKGKANPKKAASRKTGGAGGDGTAPDTTNNDANTTTNTNTTQTSALPGVLPATKEDPGGKVLWAKLANAPWWPAKTMDHSKDRSFPPDADPPRPTSIPIRFFGTHEFAWVGSKRALVDWDKGVAQGYITTKETDLETFVLGVQEAETYLKDKVLPDVFYIIPHVVQQPGSGHGGGNRKGRGKRGASAGGGGGGGLASKKFAAAGVMNGGEYPTAAMGVSQAGISTSDIITAAMAPTFGLPGGPMYTHTGAGGGGGAGRTRLSRHAPELTVEERAQVVFTRKKQRLYELGLLPPPDSPFINGVVAENHILLEKLQEWETSAPEVMQKAREQAAEKASKPPRASVFRPPVVPVVAVVQQQEQQQHQHQIPGGDPAATAAAIAAMQNQNAAYMMGMMNMNQHGLSLASFV
ncbi:hypothetical protein Ndes2526B_g07410 [Nannochloris sp. 'desiccata']|nr:hypothetical protein KSW81_004587 [Chlorella desiccata (nom. nud.)]KAH7618466.1 hypothetical protein NADE_000658 [Chlorella desiccata (nom. nud.)]